MTDGPAGRVWRAVGRNRRRLARGGRAARGSAPIVASVILLGGCGSAGRAAARPAPCPTCAAQIAQVRADTYASVAMRTYREEVVGAPNVDAVARIAPLPGLVAGLETGNYPQARRALLDQPVRHAVRAQVVRSGRVLVDVGLDFVIAGHPRALTAPDGRDLGRIEVSIQDVSGFIILIHRLTGTHVVVRGSLGHAQSSLAPALGARLPASGPVTVHGHLYTASSFQRPGFGGEQLSIWVLAPTG